jgi:hypothetical protein
MVVKQPNEEDGICNRVHEIRGDPAGNRTQMTGLEVRPLLVGCISFRLAV